MRTRVDSMALWWWRGADGVRFDPAMLLLSSLSGE